MSKTRREMMETEENLGWCVPFQIRSTDQMNQWDMVFTLQDGMVASIKINGEEREADAWTTAEILEMLADPYNREFVTEELSCSRCPWFCECDAMEDPKIPSLAKLDIRELNLNAQSIFENSDNFAIQDMFDGCETIEEINERADSLVEVIEDGDAS